MQRQYSAVGSLTENNTDQGSVSNRTSMSRQSSINSLLNPVENRLLTDNMSYNEASCVNAVSHNGQSFSGWTSGESSSRTNMQIQAIDDGMKMEGFLSSVSTHSAVCTRSEERQNEPSEIMLPNRTSNGIGGNQFRSGQLRLLGSSSNSVLPSLNPTEGYVGDSGNVWHGTRTLLGPNCFSSAGLDMEQTSSGASHNDVGPSGSSSFMVEETNGGSGSSLGVWGLSCKRKALEGTSGHSYPGGSSSAIPHSENGAQHTGAGDNASSSLSLSPTSWNSLSVCPSEQSNTRPGLGMRGVASDATASSGVTGNADPLRNYGRRLNTSHQQEQFNLSAGSARHSNPWSTHQPLGPAPFSESVDFRSTPAVNSVVSQALPHALNASAPSRTTHPFPWNGSSTSTGANSSSFRIPGERGASFQEEVNMRSISRNSGDHSLILPLNESRNTGQDPAGWSLVSGSMSTSANVSPSRVGPSSSIHPLPTPTWFPRRNSAPQNQQRFSEFAPWSLFPPMESESGGQSGNFLSSSGPSASSQESVMSSGPSGRGHNRPFLRSGFLMEGLRDDTLGMPRSLRALAADIEGRHQLISEIRQVLSAMRRGESLRIEDYMLFDPFTHHSMAEVHDRHRDMRLDVDNMSYEELLALEERIGDVNTGLSEGQILKLMKKHKYLSMTAETSADLEPCSICQEEYVDGDDLGTLDCGHDFHTDCIKQWLVLKNICPICKMTALPT